MISTIITAVVVSVAVIALLAYCLIVYGVMAVLIGLVMPPKPPRLL